MIVRRKGTVGGDNKWITQSTDRHTLQSYTKIRWRPLSDIRKDLKRFKKYRAGRRTATTADATTTGANVYDHGEHVS